MLMAEPWQVTASEIVRSLRVCGGEECSRVSRKPGSRPGTWPKRAAWIGSLYHSLRGRAAAADSESAQDLTCDLSPKNQRVTKKVGCNNCRGQRRAMPSFLQVPSCETFSAPHPRQPRWNKCSQWLREEWARWGHGEWSCPKVPPAVDHKGKEL